MAESEQTRNQSSAALDTRATRVDPAHPRAGDAIAPPAPAMAASREISTVQAVQQVRSHAAQLAAHLQRERTAVDHRESELNARLADMENQVRSARLWLSERSTDLEQQKADLDRREQELAAREARLDGRDAKPSRKKPPASEIAPDRSELFTEREIELDRRQAELDELAARLADRLSEAERSGDAQKLLRAVEARREALERAEKLLIGDQAELERQRVLLAEERLHAAEQIQMDRARFVQDQQQATAEQDHVRQDLKRRTDELAARHAVLERMKADAARSQQEALEIRLATEELWARLCGTMAPAALTQSLAQIRLKLAEEHRLARSELAQQKLELQTMSDQLAEQHRRLVHEREDFQAWMQQRQKELEQQAGILVRQEGQIESERTKFKEQAAAWQNERFRLQQEIRRLLRQTHRAEAAAAA